MSKKTLPEKTRLFFTRTGFGVKAVSKEAIRNNLEKLKHIAKRALEYRSKK